MGIQSRQYYWKAQYEDGTEIYEYEDGEENDFSDIDQERIDTFSWISDQGLPSYTLDIEDWQRLIAFRRHVVHQGNDQILVYALGWQATIDGTNYKTINFIFPDGSVIMGEDI